MELLLSKCLGEYACNLFCICIVLQIDDPFTYHLSYVMNMDLDVFSLFPLHWISAKLESTMISTPNDSWMVELDSKISEEFLNPELLNSDFDHSYVLYLFWW